MQRFDDGIKRIRYRESLESYFFLGNLNRKRLLLPKPQSAAHFYELGLFKHVGAKDVLF